MSRTARSFLDKHEVEKSVVDLARERVSLCFDRFDHVAVAFSGGKDSTVVLNLVLDEHKRRGITEPLDVLFYDEEAIPHETEDYVRRVGARADVALRWFCLPIKHVNACSPSSPWWYPWAPEARDLWCRDLPEEAITEWTVPDGISFLAEPPESRPQIAEFAPAFFHPKDYGTVAYVMGIRADESMTRLRAVTRRMEDNWLIPYETDYSYGNVTKAYCIYDWRTTDVWRAPGLYGWDRNTAYDLQELHGFHGARQRIAPPFGAEPMQMLGMYATCWPALWDRMCERVPGAATAARYSRTELYSFKARPTPADGETWKELINRLLDRWPEAEQKKIRDRIREEIRWHYRNTPNPILPTAPHPITGMTAEFLAMIAMRGDLKKRRTAGWELGENTPENHKKVALEYREQYRSMLLDKSLARMKI